MVCAVILAAANTVSFSCPPIALRYLDKDLGEVLETKVTVDSVLQNEVVVIEASDVTPEELKSKIAQVVCGKWVTTDSGASRLIFDQEAEDTQYAVIEKKHLNALKEWRKMYAGRYEALKNRPIDIKELAIGIQTKQTSAQSPMLPYERLSFELVENIPDEQIVRAMLGDRAIFGSPPTSLQHPISNGEKIVGLRARQTSELSAELRRMGFAEPETEFDLGTQFSAGYAPEIKADGASVVLNFGGRRMTGMDYQLSSLMEREGRMITSLTMFPTYPSLSGFAGMRPGTPKNLKMEGVTSQFKNRFATQKALIERSAKSKKLILDMPASDPIAWYIGDSLNAWAKAENVDFVACLPDETLRCAFNDEVFYNAPQWFGEVELGWGEEGSWRTLDSWYPWEVRRDRMDRLHFANLANRIRRGDEPRAIDQAANNDELQVTESAIFRYLRVSQPSLLPYYMGTMMGGGSDGSLVPFLSSGSIQSMLRGTQMVWSQLPPQDRALILDAACARTGTVRYFSDDDRKRPQERDWRKMEPSIWMARPEMKDAPVRLKTEGMQEVGICLKESEGQEPAMIQVYA